MRKTHVLFLIFRLNAGSHEQVSFRWTGLRGSFGKHVKQVLCTCSAALKHIIAEARNTHGASGARYRAVLVHAWSSSGAALTQTWCEPGADKVRVPLQLWSSSGVPLAVPASA